MTCSKYKDRPLIGKYAKPKGDKFLIEWMLGTYSGRWKVWKGRGDQVGYTDVLPLSNVILHPITFTKAMKLAPSTVAQLKECYKNKD